MSELSKNKIKWIRSLQLKKFRDQEELFVVEGEKIVREALEICPDQIHTLVHTEDFLPDNKLTYFEEYITTKKSLEQISSLKTPNKVLAVMKRRSVRDISSDKLIIALDGVQDPGNLGTIIRIADWFGIDEIICSEKTVDHYNPKVIQACMGAIFRVNVHYLNLEDFFLANQLPVYGALLDGKNIYESELKKNGVLLLGNEGKGISPELIPYISHPITIPKFGGAESLNVSVATGIIISEFMRSA